MKRIREWIEWKVVNIVTDLVQIGGNCGCCGKHIPNELFPVYWAYGLCKECRDHEDELR